MNKHNYLFKRVVRRAEKVFVGTSLFVTPNVNSYEWHSGKKRAREAEIQRRSCVFSPILIVCIHAHSIHCEGHEHSHVTLPHIKSNIFFCVHCGWRWVQTFCLYCGSFCLPPLWHIVFLLILDCFI